MDVLTAVVADIDPKMTVAARSKFVISANERNPAIRENRISAKYTPIVLITTTAIVFPELPS
ncbi:hypothetical protein GCM10027174_25260 [Salinifilum aidingensis]